MHNKAKKTRQRSAVGLYASLVDDAFHENWAGEQEKTL